MYSEYTKSNTLSKWEIQEGDIERFKRLVSGAWVLLAHRWNLQCQGFSMTPTTRILVLSAPIALHALTVEPSGLQILRGIVATRKYTWRTKNNEEKESGRDDYIWNDS